MIPLLVSVIVALVIAIVVLLLTIKFSRPHCQDVDTVEECDGGDPISTKEMGPSKFMGV